MGFRAPGCYHSSLPTVQFTGVRGNFSWWKQGARLQAKLHVQPLCCAPLSPQGSDPSKGLSVLSARSAHQVYRLASPILALPGCGLRITKPPYEDIIVGCCVFCFSEEKILALELGQFSTASEMFLICSLQVVVALHSSSFSSRGLSRANRNQPAAFASKYCAA